MFYHWISSESPCLNSDVLCRRDSFNVNCVKWSNKGPSEQKGRKEATCIYENTLFINLQIKDGRICFKFRSAVRQYTQRCLSEIVQFHRDTSKGVSEVRTSSNIVESQNFSIVATIACTVVMSPTFTYNFIYFFTQLDVRLIHKLLI